MDEATLTSIYGFWAKPAACFRAANDTTIGPTEGLPAIKAVGYGCVLFDPKTGEWADERRICGRIGLPFAAWTRVTSAADLDFLLAAKQRWNGCVGVVPDVEIGNGSGIGDTRDPGLMRRTLLTMSRAGVAMITTDGWADPIGAWMGYRRWVGGPQCFPEQDHALWDVRGCSLHAGAFFRAVVPWLGAWRGPLPRKPVLADYERDGRPFVVFPADEVEDWQAWKP